MVITTITNQYFWRVNNWFSKKHKQFLHLIEPIRLFSNTRSWAFIQDLPNKEHFLPNTERLQNACIILCFPDRQI